MTDAYDKSAFAEELELVLKTNLAQAGNDAQSMKPPADMMPATIAAQLANAHFASALKRIHILTARVALLEQRLAEGDTA